MFRRYSWLLILVGILSLLAGFWVLSHPGMALAGLGTMVALFFLVDGISHVVQYFTNEWKSGWSLFNGIITAFLATMLLTDGFGARTLFMATMIAFWVLISGITRLMMSFDVKKLDRAAGSTLMWDWYFGDFYRKPDDDDSLVYGSDGVLHDWIYLYLSRDFIDCTLF